MPSHPGSLIRRLLLALRQVFQAAPREAALLLGLLALGGLLPVAVLGLTRTLVDGLARELGRGSLTLDLFWPLAGLALAFALDFLLVPWVAFLQGAVNEKLTARVHLLLMEKAAGLPDLTPFAQYTSKRGTTPLGWTCAHVDGQVPIGGGPHGTAYPTHQRLEAILEGR
ncbi:MAG: hypothetical protein ABWJ63_06030, partial [Thermus sp.]